MQTKHRKNDDYLLRRIRLGAYKSRTNYCTPGLISPHQWEHRETRMHSGANIGVPTEVEIPYTPAAILAEIHRAYQARHSPFKFLFVRGEGGVQISFRRNLFGSPACGGTLKGGGICSSSKTPNCSPRSALKRGTVVSAPEQKSFANLELSVGGRPPAPARAAATTRQPLPQSFFVFIGP